MALHENTVEICVRVPAALRIWATEHKDQLSADTLGEVRAIADELESSPLGDIDIARADQVAGEHLGSTFEPARSKRAATLLQVVAAWFRAQPPEHESPDASPPPSSTRAASSPEAGAPGATAAPRSPADPDPTAPASPLGAGPRFEPVPAPAPTTPATTTPSPATPAPTTPSAMARPGERSESVLSDTVAAPAFLRSDKVDEEDDVRLYGPRRPWKAIVSTLVALALLAGLGVAGWYWFTQRDDNTDVATEQPDTAPDPTVAPTVESAAEPTAQSQETPTPAPTPTPDPAQDLPTFWADVAPILNSGTAEIQASTYAVSPANRAVLTGHLAAITGLAVSNDGRVLTSGADRRLVDWGADVTLANPDVLNVPAALTVLERTADQRLIAGDAIGNITVIDLVETAEPLVISVHDVAISAATELPDGRLAVASVDGEVAVFDTATPDDRLVLPHDVEVTAVVALADGTVATAAVDGIVRLWPDGASAPGEIDTLGSPVAALYPLADGRLATSSLTGDIHVVDPSPESPNPTPLMGHIGAVRALFEIDQPDGSRALVSGGDDTTVRLWDVDTQTNERVLEGHGDIISALDVLPDGRLVSASGDGTGRIWDLTVPPIRTVIPPHDSNLSALAPWSNDQIVSGGTDGKVVLASTSETSSPTTITTHDAPIVGVGRLSNGDIVSLDANSVLRVNVAEAGAEPATELSVAPGATALATRESLGVVTGHADGTIRAHDFVEEIAALDVHGSGVNDVIVLSDGRVVSAGQDRTVRVVDFDDPGTIPVFDRHTAPVDTVVELPDGRIASAGRDGIFVFSVDGLAEDAIRLNGQRTRTISLVPVGETGLISTGDDGRIRLWDLTEPESEPTTLVDIPGIVNPTLIQADNGLFVAGAARGYVVFATS